MLKTNYLSNQFLPVKAKSAILDTMQLLLGVITASICLTDSLLPNHFLDSDVTGVALLLDRLFSIDASPPIVVINVPFLLIAIFGIFPKRALDCLSGEGPCWMG